MKITPVVLGLCALAVAGALVTFAATGAHMLTRIPSADTAAVNEEDDLAGLFDDTGLTEQHGELEQVRNEFSFGLLPSGPGLESASVATVAGPAAAVAGGALILARRRRNKAAKETDRT